MKIKPPNANISLYLNPRCKKNDHMLQIYKYTYNREKTIMPS